VDSRDLAGPVYVTIFFGLSVFDVSAAWIGRDQRWPSFSSPETILVPQSTQDLVFSYTVPDVPVGTYIGNAVLWSQDFMRAGKMCDRTIFQVTTR
jgi:hypothetical protein